VYNKRMSTIRVGVLRGGPSGEYDVSLKTGAAVLAGLAHPKFEDKYQLHDIFIDKAGTWHMYGAPVTPAQATGRIDVFFNAMHGHYGEDGKVQKILDDYRARYTGSGVLASAVSMNKALAKNLFKNHGIKTPYHIVLENKDGEIERNPGVLARHAMTIFNSFPMPAVIKPASAGSSIGISVARDFASLEPALREAFRHDDTVVVEEFISGVEATVGVLENFRGEELYVFPAIEIRPKGGFFDHAAKYGNDGEKNEEGNTLLAEEIVPGNFTPERKAELARLAQEVHRALGLRHYSRTDFIVAPRRGVYVLEANTLPGLTAASLMPKAAASVGASMPDFLDHLVTLAYEGK
jgi:D-alanine-D-alanine ligase